MNQWKFLGEGLRSNHDGSPWVIGVWREVPLDISLCKGLNASNYIQDALSFVQGEILAEVECEGEVIHSEEKSTWERMRVIRAWKWTKRESVSLAVFAARKALAEFESKYSGNDRPRKAIEAAEKWLNTESAESASAAEWSAARAAELIWSAVAAARSAEEELAARSAAWSARSAAQSTRGSAWSARAAAWSSVWAAAESARSEVQRDIHTYIIEKLIPTMELIGKMETETD